jgi:iron complex outermembrane recepter protein
MKNKIIGITLLVFISVAVLGQKTNDTVKLKEVEIRDKANVPCIKNVIDVKDIDNKAAMDIGDYLKTIPNVSGIKKGGTAIDPVVRGLKYSQLLVMPDNGVKIEGGCPNRMDPATSHIEIEDVESIEVIKGPFSLRYGPNFGGIINLITETPKPYNKFEIHAKASYGFETNWNGQREHMSIFGGNKKVYFLIGGGYNKYGSYKDGNDKTVNSGFTKYDFSGKLGYSIDDRQSVILSYISDQGRDVYYPALSMDEMKDNSNIISLDYKFDAENWKSEAGIIKLINIKIFRSDVNHIMDNSHRSNYPSTYALACVDAINTGGRAELGLKLGKGNLFIGTDFENIHKNGDRTMTMTMDMSGLITKTTKKSNLWKDALIQNTGLFSEYIISYETFDFIASIRGDYNTANSKDTLMIIKERESYFDKTDSKFLNLSASVGLTKRINENINLSVALGRGTRSPNMLERYIKFLAVGYDNYDYLGNPQLKPETNNQADLTLRYINKETGSFYINGFFSYIQDYISAQLLPPSIAMPQTQGVLGVKQFYNANYAILKGFEFGYTSPDKNKLGITASAAYTQAIINSATKYIITNKQVTGEETVKNDALPEIPPLEGKLSFNYKFMSGKLNPCFSMRLVNAQNYTSEAFYEPHTPGFFLFDFSVNFNPVKYVNLSAGVNNAFDKAYYEHLNRKIIGSTDKLYETGRVFFIKLILNI